MASFPMCSHMISSLCTWEKGSKGRGRNEKGERRGTEGEGRGKERSSILLIRVLILSDQGPLMTSLNLNYFLIPNTVTMGVSTS